MFWILLTYLLLHNVLSAKEKTKPSYNPGFIVRAPNQLSLDVRYVISNDMIKNLKMDQDSLTDFMLNATEVAQRSFAWHNIELRVVRFDIWKDEDRIKISRNYTSMLKRFSDHVAEDGVLNDVNILLVEQRGFGTEWGKSLFKTACSKNAVAVVRVCNKWNYVKVGLTIAHEIGSVFGMNNVPTNSTTCHCAMDKNKCIMNSKQFKWNCSTNSPPFHTCSINELIANDWPCLQEPIDEQNLFDTCSNGVKNEHEGETCDCGTAESCRGGDMGICCDHETCQLRPGMKCSNEACCENCEIVSGKLCRKKRDPVCDIAEYCDGGDSECDADMYVADGQSCGTNAYCFDGWCSDPTMSCQRMFRQEKNVVYSERCLRMVQALQGTVNCSNTSLWTNDTTSKFICSSKEPCPRLWCEFPGKSTQSSSITVPFDSRGETIFCRTQDDPSAFPPVGFPCGNAMGCFNGACQPIAHFVTKCRNCPVGTVCNNKGKCSQTGVFEY